MRARECGKGETGGKGRPSVMMHFGGLSKALRFHSNCDEKPSKSFGKGVL